MLLNKKTVLNENRVYVHVPLTEISGNQISTDSLIESVASPQSFLGVSKQSQRFSTLNESMYKT